MAPKELSQSEVNYLTCFPLFLSRKISFNCNWYFNDIIISMPKLTIITIIPQTILIAVEKKKSRNGETRWGCIGPINWPIGNATLVEPVMYQQNAQSKLNRTVYVPSRIGLPWLNTLIMHAILCCYEQSHFLQLLQYLK